MGVRGECVWAVVGPVSLRASHPLRSNDMWAKFAFLYKTSLLCFDCDTDTDITMLTLSRQTLEERERKRKRERRCKMEREEERQRMRI